MVATLVFLRSNWKYIGLGIVEIVLRVLAYEALVFSVLGGFVFALDKVAVKVPPHTLLPTLLGLIVLVVWFAFLLINTDVTNKILERHKTPRGWDKV